MRRAFGNVICNVTRYIPRHVGRGDSLEVLVDEDGIAVGVG